MNKEQYIIFPLESGVVLVKYTCDKKFVSEEEIENAAEAYFDSDDYSDEYSCTKIVEDILSSFKGLHYEFIDFSSPCIDDRGGNEESEGGEECPSTR